MGSYGLEPFPEQRLQAASTRVRIPDVCLVPITDSEEVIRKPPLLCVEILSPDDRWRRLVTQESQVARQVDELRWNDVVVPLSEVFPE